MEVETETDLLANCQAGSQGAGVDRVEVRGEGIPHAYRVLRCRDHREFVRQRFSLSIARRGAVDGQGRICSHG